MNSVITLYYMNGSFLRCFVQQLPAPYEGYEYKRKPTGGLEPVELCSRTATTALKISKQFLRIVHIVWNRTYALKRPEKQKRLLQRGSNSRPSDFKLRFKLLSECEI